MLRNFYDYTAHITSNGNIRFVNIKSNRWFEINAFALVIMIVSVMVSVSTLIIHAYYPKITINTGLGSSLIMIAVMVIYLYREKIIGIIKGYTKLDQQITERLAHFLWTNRLYTVDTYNRIVDSVMAAYDYKGTDIIISLDARGSLYAEQIQAMETQLSSLFPQWRYVDKRIHADRTEYIFSTLKNQRVKIDA